jgi:hypothetical protein
MAMPLATVEVSPLAMTLNRKRVALTGIAALETAMEPSRDYSLEPCVNFLSSERPRASSPIACAAVSASPERYP